MKLTPEQIEVVKALFRNGATIPPIAKQFGCAEETVRRIINPEWGATRNAQNRDARARRQAIKPEQRKPGAPPRVPADVLADRDRRREARLTVNMAILGDPVPGRSALDRMGGRHAEP